jgi:CCR4-NOT transcription complex subunit 7/8
MKLIQVGLTFMDGEGELPKLSDGTYCAWQFNFRGFDPEEDMYEPSSIALLRRCGIDFAKNRMLGVDPSLFREKLLACGLLCNRRVHYICFHGAYDFAYLLKLITCASLPADEASFLGLLQHYFGTFYDLKYMQIRLLNLHGGLEKLARSLGIKRIGPSHQAGSDSLLTSSSFQRLKDLCFLDHCQDFSGVLFGLRALPKPKAVY